MYDAPTLYACIVAEQGRERLEGYEGIGICLCHKVDGKLDLQKVHHVWRERNGDQMPIC